MQKLAVNERKICFRDIMFHTRRKNASFGSGVGGLLGGEEGMNEEANLLTDGLWLSYDDLRGGFEDVTSIKS